MKTTFIVPKDDDRTYSLNPSAAARVFPPNGLARMAGLVGRQGGVALVDERIGSAHHVYNTDIAVFFINSYNRQRCFELAERYRLSGVYVVFTGPLLAGDPEQALVHADSLLLGFGEECLAEFLSDYKRGKAKCFYHGRDSAMPGLSYKTGSGGTQLSLA